MPEGADKQPAGCVSFDAAQAYCAWLGEQLGPTVRLPTEAEWIRWATGGKDQPYEWGQWNPRRAIWNTDAPLDVDDTPLDVGKNDRGILHMTGNLAEWVDTAPKERPDYRILKGGSYLTEHREQLQVDYTLFGRTREARREWGFRIVVEWR